MEFLLVCDGSSDGALVAHIRRLLIAIGVRDPDGNYWTRGRYLADKIRNGIERQGNADLVFVHRDAESADSESRYHEIEDAIQKASIACQWVGVVPVRMTEAWLLLYDDAIRNAARKPNGTIPLNLPLPRECEQRADPKAILETALITASETTGRRRERIRRSFSTLRRSLLENLPVGGRLEQLESWRRFRDDTVAAVRALSG